MNRFWGHALSTAVLAAVAGSAFPACAHDDSTLFIQGVLYPPVPANGVCTYVVNPTAPTISRGTVDASLTNFYAPVFQIGNQLRSHVNADQLRTETSDLTIQGAVVRVVDPKDGSVQMNSTVLASGVVYASLGTIPSFLAISATILDSNAIKHFDPGLGNPANLAVTYVKFFGETLGHQSIESDEFQFPVDVCHGCLVVIPAGTQATQSQYCSGQVPAKSSAIPCVVGQDQFVDCQLCFNYSDACKP